MSDPLDVTLALDGDPMAPRRARDAVAAALNDRFRAEFVDDVKMLVSELVTNSILHGPPHPHDAIEVTLRRTPRGIRVEVADEGAGFGLPDRTPDPLRVGGLGLRLVALLANDWGIETERGTRVWFEIAPAGS